MSEQGDLNIDRDSRRRAWLVFAGLLAVTVGAYLPALGAGYVWDDDHHVTESPQLKSVEGLIEFWVDPASTLQYYPLVHSSFWLEYQLFELHPFGYHLNNVLLHVLSAFLVFRIVRRLGWPGATLAAFLFALHPVHVESVAWVSERKNTLSGVFYLLSLQAWIHWAWGGASARKARNYALALGLFVCALLSKTVTCSLPAVILLLVYLREGRIRRADWLAMAPFFAVGLLLALPTAFYERDLVRAEGPPWEIPFAERCLIAGRALWFYAGKLLFPHPLSFNYELWEVNARAPLQWAFPLGWLGLIAASFALRQRIGRAPLVALLVFSGTLFPALGFINVYPMRYSYVADHFQYLASLALLIGAAALWTKATRSARWASVVVLVVLTLLAGKTYFESRNYEDLDTIFSDVIEKNPGSVLAHTNLGKLRLDEGEDSLAMQHLRAAVANDSYAPEAWSTLGVCHARAGNPSEARRCYEQSLVQRPGFVDALSNLAALEFELGNLDECEALLRQALEQSPGSMAPNLNLGILLAARDEHETAARYFEIALASAPNNPEIWRHRARSLQALGETSEAANAWVQLLVRQPGAREAIDQLARICAEREGQELMLMQGVAAAVPADARALWLRLSRVLADEGRRELAAEALRRQGE